MVLMYYPGKMSCCHKISVHIHGKIQKSFEFDFIIAHNVGIGRTAIFQLIQKILKNTLLIFLLKVYIEIRNLQIFANGFYILKIFLGSTHAVFIGF